MYSLKNDHVEGGGVPTRHPFCSEETKEPGEGGRHKKTL